jgi:hypothetical protein
MKSKAYLFCALLYLIYAFFEKNHMYFYCIPPLLCTAQYIRPTKIGWFVIFIPVFILANVLLWCVCEDVSAIQNGSQPKIFVDAFDSMVWIATAIFLVCSEIWLWFVRPLKSSSLIISE